MLGIIGIKTVLTGVSLIVLALYLIAPLAVDIPVLGTVIAGNPLRFALLTGVGLILFGDRLRWWTSILRRLPYPLKAARAARLDGEWVGSQFSNWPIVSARRTESENNGSSSQPDLLETQVEAIIRVRIFGTSMCLKSISGYQESDTISARLHDEGQDKEIRLAYLFRSSVPTPELTDEGSFMGAADLRLEKQTDGSLLLTGPMFTNRSWQNGLNTAGTIRLTEKGKAKSAYQVV